MSSTSLLAAFVISADTEASQPCLFRTTIPLACFGYQMVKQLIVNDDENSD